MRKKCPYSELFWLVFSRIRTDYGEIRSISPYSVQMRENKDQNNSEYGHFKRSIGSGDINLLHCEIFKNSFFTENHLATASGVLKRIFVFRVSQSFYTLLLPILRTL